MKKPTILKRWLENDGQKEVRESDRGGGDLDVVGENKEDEDRKSSSSMYCGAEPNKGDDSDKRAEAEA